MELKPQSTAQRKLVDASIRAAAHLPPALPPTLFLTDPHRTPDPITIAQHLPIGWGVIYRHFGAGNRDEIAAELAETAQSRGLHLLISADPQLAKAVGAAGVHWPFAKRAGITQWRDTFELVTISAHSAEELHVAAACPVNAVILSAVFPSDSPSAGPAIGSDQFAQLSATVTKPVFALGGITHSTVGEIIPAPFASVSGIADAFAPRT